MSEGAQCTECSKTLSTDVGMKLHRSRVHGIVDTVTLVCEECGDNFDIKESRADGRRFCGTDCSIQHLHRTREYTRREGPKPSYGPEWSQARERCLERDDYRCQSCGCSEDELQDSLHAHHIRPFLGYDDRSEAHRLENLVALCKRCHYDWEGIPVRPSLLG